MSTRGLRSLLPAGLATVLVLPSLWVGLQFDDHAQRATLRAASGPAAAMMDLFTFLDGQAAHARAAMDAGDVPWWTLPTAHESFWRPVAAWTHWLDHALWPEHPWRMHAHSVLWFAALVAAAAGLYRLMLPTAHGAPWRTTAGLAAVLYAVDDAHGFAAGWIANRNALMAALFGVLCLHGHVRWRRDGWRPGVVAAPAWLVLGLLSSEAAVATLAYLAAFAICLEGGSWRRRLGTLLPSLLVVLAWAAVYRALGFGAWGTAYVDPLREPLQFGRAVVLRGPVLLLGQWALPPAEAFAFLLPVARIIVTLAAWAVLAGVAWLLAPTLRRSATARFWGLGMLLAVVPSCAAIPANRLLFFVGLGAMALLAELLVAALPATFGPASADADAAPPPTTAVDAHPLRTIDIDAHPPQATEWRARATRVGARVLVAIHLGLAPLLMPVAAASPAVFGGIERAALRLPAAPAGAEQTDVFVSAPSFFSTGFLRTVRAEHGRATAARVRYLGAGLAALDLTRPDARTLEAHPAGGYMRGFDALFRGPGHPLALGQTVDLAGMSATVMAVTPDGRPAAVRFRFAVPLDDPTLRWFEWRDGVFVPFTVPAVGGARTVPNVAALRLGRGR